MKEKRKNAFTLIELLAVIVVLAVLALIAVPIVLNIINKANKQSEERSIESYVRALDYAISECMMENPKLKKENIIIDNYEVKVSSTNEVCAKIDVSKTTEITGCTYEVSDNEKGYNLMNCQIKDNYYNYIDGKVVAVKEKTYTAYNIGDEITYKGMKFYVISPSDTKQDYVTLLKAEPIKYSDADWSTTEIASKISQDSNGYLKTAYLFSDTCTSLGVVNGTSTGCSTNYKLSSVKQIVDTWLREKLTQDYLKDIDEYKARLLTHDELTTNLGYEKTTSTIDKSTNGETPNWVYNSNYNYWTMSPYNDSTSLVWVLGYNGYLYNGNVDSQNGVVRPVINLLKSAIQ